MKDKIQIDVEVFSDLICPWCFIGKRKLESAAKMHGGVTLRRHWRAFLLNPHMPQEGMARAHYINAKFGSAGAGLYDRIAMHGREAGIEFRFDAITRTPDSRRAHAVLATASMHDSADADAVAEDLFRAYFMEAKDIGDESVLAGIAAKHGIAFPPQPSASAQVEGDFLESGRLGIAGIPYFIFGGSMAMSGAQPIKSFLALFDSVIAKRRD